MKKGGIVFLFHSPGLPNRNQSIQISYDMVFKEIYRERPGYIMQEKPAGSIVYRKML